MFSWAKKTPQRAMKSFIFLALLVFVLIVSLCNGQDYQPAIFDPLLPASAYLIVFLRSSASKSQAQQKIAQALQLINDYSTKPDTKFSATVSIGIELARQWFPRYSTSSLYGKTNGLTKGYAASGGDILIHVKCKGRDIAYEFARDVKPIFASIMTGFADEYGFSYLFDPKTGFARDVSGLFLWQSFNKNIGFIDGTANPQTRQEQEKWAIIPPNYSPGEPGGGSFLLTQKWVHNGLDSFLSSPLTYQEETIGRRKNDSVKLDNIDPRAHIVRSKAGMFKT